MVATSRKCLACRKREADTDLAWPPLCGPCLARAGDSEEIQKGIDVVSTVDQDIRGGVVRLEDHGELAVVKTPKKGEVTIPVANLIATL